MMIDISLETFNWLTSNYGKINGNSFLDARENVTHEIFPDKVIIGSNFINCATYQVYFTNDHLHVTKFELDNPLLEESAKMVHGDMTEEDQTELQLRWNTMVRDLQAAEKLQNSGNARNALAKLYLNIFEEDQALELIDELPSLVKPAPTAVWEELAVALQNSGNLVEFEWSDLTDTGIYALNELEPIQMAGIVLDVPTEEEYEEIIAADDFAKASLEFVNQQLKEHDLKIVAIGTVLDEFQAFTCLPAHDGKLAHALAHLTELCLVYLY
ncbi:DUF6630 family protein [Chitinophaga dinghuensis]|nr:hypothetical protein [Chitinophaga dinghuensis]